jgi:hypothetical protein
MRRSPAVGESRPVYRRSSRASGFVPASGVDSRASTKPLVKCPREESNLRTRFRNMLESGKPISRDGPGPIATRRSREVGYRG